MNQQVLHGIEYKKLKNVKNTYLDFDGHDITGIFGINGSGKSTILQSMLCLYKPSEKDPNRFNYKFSDFFTPTTHATWAGSEIIAKISYRLQQNQFTLDKTYTKVSDRWSPKYDRRPSRDVYYLGIETCVPDIEKETYSSRINFERMNLNRTEATKIQQIASYVLKKQIDEFILYSRRNKEYFGFRETELQYSSLFMGAGEQRVLRLATILVKCPKYSLIIVDELDLTLHTLALNRILEKMSEIAREKKLQIVFTSHREELLKRNDINVRHLHQTTEKTIILNRTTLDCITRLNGELQKKIEIFVEDDVSKQIVSKIIEKKNITRFCEIRRYGAIENAFSLLTGLYLKGDDLSNTLVVMDGDKYNSFADKLTQLKKHLTGNEPGKDELRETLLNTISEYNLYKECNPEKHIILSLKSYDDGSEICEIAKDINFVEDNHDYINDLIGLLGCERVQGLFRVVDKYAECTEFYGMVDQVSIWLNSKIHELKLIESE